MSPSENPHLPKVLFVDDDPIVTRFVENTFGQLPRNFAPVVANDGLQAIEILKNEPIKAVITDLQMPKMCGTELLSYIFENHPDIPCGVLTSTPNDVQLKTDLIKTFIKKPVRAFTIQSAVKEMLYSENKLSGHISGISLANVLQLVESEAKNCTVEVISKTGESGFFYLKQGRLLDAKYGDHLGIEAAQELLRLPVREILMGSLPKVEPHAVLNISVMNLLLDVLKQVDEENQDDDITLNDLDSGIISTHPSDSKAKTREKQIKLLIKPLIEFKRMPFFSGMLITDTFGQLLYSKSDVSFLNKTNMHKILDQLSLEGNQIENASIGETNEVLWTTDKVVLIYQQSPVLGNIQLKMLMAITPGPHQNMFRAKLRHAVKHALAVVTQSEAYQKLALGSIT